MLPIIHQQYSICKGSGYLLDEDDYVAIAVCQDWRSVTALCAWHYRHVSIVSHRQMCLQDEVSNAVATVITEINAQVAQLPTSGAINGMQLQQQIASLLYLSQTSVFQAIPAVASGMQAPSDFTSMYTGANLASGVNTALGYVTSEAPVFTGL